MTHKLKEQRDHFKTAQEEMKKEITDLEENHQEKIETLKSDTLKANKELSKEIKANLKTTEDSIWNMKSQQKEINDKLKKDVEEVTFKIEKTDFYIKDTYSKSEATDKKAIRLNEDYIALFKTTEKLN